MTLWHRTAGSLTPDADGVVLCVVWDERRFFSSQMGTRYLRMALPNFCFDAASSVASFPLPFHISRSFGEDQYCSLILPRPPIQLCGV